MGVRANITVVPKAIFKKYKNALADLPISADWAEFELDKTWMHLHTAFREMPKPLSLVVSGDYAVYGRLEGGMILAKGEKLRDDDDGEEDEGDDFYMGCFSPGLVERAHEALRAVTDKQLLAAIKAQGWSSAAADRRYYLDHFRSLKKAYKVAATNGDALMIMID